MQKVFIYLGAKGAELPIIKRLLPHSFDKVIEPFAGSAVVTFDLEKDAIINDFNIDIMNLYEVIADPLLYPQLMNRLQSWKNLNHKDDKEILQKKYYDLREQLNKKDYSDKLGMAETYLVIRQLCHCGLQRENAKGEFNVPYGHGRKFTTPLSEIHHQFLNHKVQLMQGDFETCIAKAGPNDWIFVDPPYWETQDYNKKGFTEEDHRRLARVLSQTSAKWLLIHKDCDLYRELYANYIIEEEDFTYKIHHAKKNVIKKNCDVKHLYIRNYDNYTVN